MEILENEDVNPEMDCLLDKELLREVAEYAIREYEAGRCIPNSHVKDVVMKRLGWE